MEREGTARLPNENFFRSWEREWSFEQELHVACEHEDASDQNPGTVNKPFKTICAAAEKAVPGTRVLIHEGTYRECVKPQYGGEGVDRIISYEAYKDDKVIIKASEVVSRFEPSVGWDPYPHGSKDSEKNEEMNIWEVKLNPSDFQGYNPFCAVNILHDRLFIEYDKTDMTTYLNRRGMVFCDGKPLKQVSLYNQLSKESGSYWVEANGQTVHFRLEKDDDPKEHTIELTCREQCFAPDIPFLSYIRVKGLTCAHAATGAPVPQRGAISCYRGHHWVIEDCTVDWSNGVGIDIGNECWHHTRDTSQIIGYHIIRGCQIYDVGVCGIAALFAKNLLIEDNLIEGTGWQKMELSWEAAGIKVHGCADSLFRRNVFKGTLRSDHLWLDMFNENNRITQNLFLDGYEQREAIFIECSRDGINLIDNNIFWNIEGRFDKKTIPSEPGSSGWYKHEEAGIVNGYAVYGEGTDHLRIVNNFIGKCQSAGYYAKAVPFRIVGPTRGGTSRDAGIYNNIFYDCKEAAIKFPDQHNASEGNLFLNMPGGYLRILYPAPAVCLDLQAWNEFYGFDEFGSIGCLDVDIDTKTLTMTVTDMPKEPMDPFGRSFGEDYIFNCCSIKPVPVREIVAEDFFGESADDEVKRIPGPFQLLRSGETVSIDPRNKH